MSSNEQDNRPAAERVQDIPRIMQALREAAAEARKRHRQAGVPMAVWRNGRVELIEPEDIPITEDEVEASCMTTTSTSSIGTKT